MLTSATMIDVPESIGSGFATVAELEYGTSPYANTYGRLAHVPGGVQTIRDGIDGGDVRNALPYGEILEPLGMDDEVRLLFRGRDDRVWGGAGTLMRGAGNGFGDPEVRALAACAREIGEGLRLSLIRQAPLVMAEVSGGPAVVVVGGERRRGMGDVASVGIPRPDRRRFLRPDDARGRIRRAIPELGGVGEHRARTADGEWLVLRAGRLDGRGSRGRVVVTLEPARPAQLVALVTELHRLTAREAEVLGHVLACETRTEIGQRMFISRTPSRTT